MSKYDKLTRAQMIKQLEDHGKKIKQEESLWRTDEGKAKRFRSEEDLKIVHRIETLDDIINTPSSQTCRPRRGPFILIETPI